MKMEHRNAREARGRFWSEEEPTERHARQHPSPGKVTRTMRLAHSLGSELEARDANSSHAASGLNAHDADSKRVVSAITLLDHRVGRHDGVRGLFGAIHPRAVEQPILGSGVDAMAHLALPPGALGARPQAPIQRKAADEVPTSEIHIGTAGGGEQLPDEVRAKMERALGMDFSEVRIHVGRQAESVGALAFTQGMDIFFAPGQYQPQSQRGQELLGHELTHVVQQAGGRVQATTQHKRVDINDDVSLEREADKMGARAARGQHASILGVSSRPQPKRSVVIQAAPNGEAPTVEDMSEEELKAVIFKSKDGRPRYVEKEGKLVASPPVDKTARGRSWTLEVDESTFKAARRALSALNADKAGAKQDAQDVVPEFAVGSGKYAGKSSETPTIEGLKGARDHIRSTEKEAKGPERRQLTTERKMANKRLQAVKAEAKANELTDQAEKLREQARAIPRDSSRGKRRRRVLFKQATAIHSEAARQRAHANRVMKSGNRKSSAKDELKRSFKPNGIDVDAGGQFYSKGKSVDVAALKVGEISSKTLEGKTEFLQAGAGANVSAGISKDGVHGAASANAEANLAKVNYEFKILDESGQFMGEEVGFKLYLKFSGSVGAEARASIQAQAGKAVKKSSKGVPKVDPVSVLDGTGLDVDPKTGQVTAKDSEKLGVNAKASAGGFAGAKASLAIGAAIEWKKKNSKQYMDKLNNSAQVLLDLVCGSMGPLGAPLRYVLDKCEADEAAEWVLDKLFTWGAPGTVPLVGVEGMIEGSAGAGATAMAEIGFSGSKFVWHTQANVTWGLGVGTSVKVSLDLVEGIKFALLVLGELREPAIKYARQKIKGAIGTIDALLDGLWDWFTADDEVRKSVAKNVHKLAKPEKRATMIKTLMDGYCGTDDESAIAQILLFSKQNGDLDAVISHGGGERFKSRILDKVDDGIVSIALVRNTLGVK